jgi:hypothetical protein
MRAMTMRTITSTHALSRFQCILAAFAAAVVAQAAATAAPLTPIGLSAARTYRLEEVGAFPADPGPGDHYGFALAAGDFNHDGFDDLATGIPYNPCDADTDNCGAVEIRFGAPTGALGGALHLDPNGIGQFGQLPPEPTTLMDEYGYALAAGDFNADGYADLAVGVPGNGPFGFREIEGGVQIHYGLHGSIGSIEWVAEHFLATGVNGVPAAEPGALRVTFENRFGEVLATGDFDGDGHDDLAIGVPAGEVGGGPETLGVDGGCVLVGQGHIGGLVPFEGFLMREGLLGLPGVPTQLDRFGAALATGDFNGDGFDDLAIGVPNNDHKGAVLIVYGSEFSLLFAAHQYFDLTDLGGTAQTNGHFGWALAAGDFDGDGFDDLAASAPDHDLLGAIADAGQVSTIRGSSSGLLPGTARHFVEDHLSGAGTSEHHDRFGEALASGDFNGDGVDDLVVGTLAEGIFLVPELGVVTVIQGEPVTGLAFDRVRQLFATGPAGEAAYRHDGMIPDHREPSQLWGAALTTGDFDGNGFSDLVIGAPWRDQPADGAEDSGATAAIFGHLFVDGFDGGHAEEWSVTTP